jgi:hypothetical protein
MLEKIDTGGGHIVVCLLLLLIGAGFFLSHVPKAEDVIVFSLGVLARSMMDRKVS